jgi:hypothetical protein
VTRMGIRALLVAGAVAALTAGCGSTEAGSAATVGDRRISVQELQTATNDIQKLYGPNQPVPQRSVLFLLAAAPYLEAIAVPEDAGASLSDARKVFGETVPNPSHAALVVMQANTTLGNLDQLGNDKTTQALQQVSKSLADDHFTVNPRYGEFDPTRGSLLPEQPNWLPTPSPTPSQ